MSCYNDTMQKFYIAIEPSDYLDGNAEEVEARDIESAAKGEACRLFDTECDPEGHIDVYVAKGQNGEGCKKFTISREVVVHHHVEAEEDIDVAALVEED